MSPNIIPPFITRQCAPPISPLYNTLGRHKWLQGPL
eukprot:CCRYP_014447-RA/>CCRYP_014447-RA protein AED:0.49 eAED:0.49 QI:0/-1/0/1/-1/0/1/0/35